MVGAKKRKELSEGLRGLFGAASREVALRLASELAAHWRRSHPNVACRIEEHIEECLSCLAFPDSHRRRIRTTNVLENPHTQYGYNSLTWSSSVSPIDQVWYPRIHFWRV
jgi:transposase-like protein